VPPGSARYWSWLFAAPAAREPLLGMYALGAEWRALLEPATDSGVAQAKLVWWRDEVLRLCAGSPVHPITRHIAALPQGGAVDCARLDAAVAAVAAELAGVPLERASDLEPHATALYGIPLLLAARLGTPCSDWGAVQDCITALATAEYLARAHGCHRRDARRGRIAFPVDQLLAAGIDNDDLAADVPSPQLAVYLDGVRLQAAGCFSAAAAALDPGDRPGLRHLSVIAALGLRHLGEGRSPTDADFRFGDLYNAWSAARRAAAGR
jgi:phytoene synthase